MNYATALVTGANGFLGRALVKRLQEDGRHVTALVRRPDGSGSRLDRVVADIRDTFALRESLTERRFDVVFHLAAAGVAPQDRASGTLFATNAAATGALIEICAEAGARGFVYAGSCSEYEALGSRTPISEDCPLTRSNTYGAAKAAGGLWGAALARSQRVGFCWLRFFGIFGPGEAPDRLIPYLARRLAEDSPVDLTPGEQARDLTYVDDAVTALLLAAECALRGQEGPFNVCTGRGTEVRDIARAVADALRKPHDLLRFGERPYRSDEPMWLVGDPGRFRQATGFEPRIDLVHGIDLTLRALGQSR